MFAEHPSFQSPENENVKIWRYLDFTKFVALLDKRALFFSRADQLGDPFEGSYSQASVLERQNKVQPADAEFMKQVSQTMPKAILINCWHINEHESAAMWKLYLKSDEGIAIQSRYSRLKQSLQAAPEKVYIGKVNYIDYEVDIVPPWNGFNPFLYKRKSFEHECELRAVIDTLEE